MVRGLVCVAAWLLTALSGAAAEAPVVAGEVLVRLVSDARLPELRADFAAVGLEPTRLISPRAGIWVMRFTPGDDAREDRALLGLLRDHPAVALAQFNHRVALRELLPDVPLHAGERLVPDDPLFPDQWALDYTYPWYDPDIDAPEAWELGTSGTTVLGDTIVIAIVDSGSDLSHQDLRFWVNRDEIPGNGRDDDHDGYIDDIHGWNALQHNGTIPAAAHGAHVGGVAAARGDNGLGVCGVAWNVRIMPVVAMETEAAAVEAYDYVLAQRSEYNASDGARGAFVVAANTSFGIDQGDPSEFPVWCLMYDLLGEAGVVSTAATANHGWDVDLVGDMPTACPSDYLVTVTSTTIGNGIYYRAAWGAETIDLGAPGENILSTDLGQGYTTRTGTSQAAPHVAGAVALLVAAADAVQLEAYRGSPGAIALALKEALLRTVDPLSMLQGRTVSGGRLNLHAAVEFWRASSTVAAEEPSVRPQIAAEPNPFTDATRLRWPDGAAGECEVTIVDLQGRRHRAWFLSAGVNEVRWDGSDASRAALPGGVYYCRVRAGGREVSTRLTLVR